MRTPALVPPFDALFGLLRELGAWLESVERSIVRFVSCDLYTPVLHPILYWAQEKVVAIPLMVVTLVAIAFHDRRRGLRALVAALLAIGLAMLVAEVFWNALPRERPPQVFERVVQGPHATELCERYPDVLPLRKDRAISSSFPSRHALTAGTFAAVVFLAWRTIGWWAVAYGLLVAYGRVYGGKHWPTDVIAGFALGAWLGWLSWRLVPRLFALLGRPDLVRDPPEQPDAPAG